MSLLCGPGLRRIEAEDLRRSCRVGRVEGRYTGEGVAGVCIVGVSRARSVCDESRACVDESPVDLRADRTGRRGVVGFEGEDMM
jgi:hypothetical protein